MLKKKTWGFFSIFILITCLNIQPLFAELTKEDVRQIIREELEPVKTEIVAMKGEIQGIKITITEMEKQINIRFSELDKRTAAQFSAVDSKFNAIDDKFTILQWLISGLIAITVAAIAIPQLLIAYREKKEAVEGKLCEEIEYWE